MSFWDKVKSFFKSGLGNPGGEAATQMSSFVGSGYSTIPYSSTGGEKYFQGLSNPGISPYIDNRTIRQNARRAYHESIAARSLVDRYADTTIGVGLRLDSTPQADILGITPEQAEEWATRVEKLFDIWASSKKSSRNETLTFYQAQRLAEISQQRDGEYFPRLHYTKNRERPNPLQIGFIDPNQIRGDAFTSTSGFQDDSTTDGIVRDSAGRETAYLVWVKKSDGTFEEKRIPARGARSKRRLVLHGYAPEYAGQGRGYSRLGHALQEFSDLTDFTVAQIKKAIIQSSIPLWVKPSQDKPASDPFEGITHPAGPTPVSETPAPETTAESLANADGIVYHPLPEATVVQPGQVGVFTLNSGEGLEAFKSTAPTDSFDRFVEAFTGYLGASIGMPGEVLSMKFGENYSASRGTLLLFWQVANIWRNEMISDFLAPVFEEWLVGEIAAGRVTAPGWSDPTLRQAWLHHTWYGAPMPNIDPLRTAKADETYIGLGAQTLDRVARDHNGSDGAFNRAKLRREIPELPQMPWRKSDSAAEKQEGDDGGGEDSDGGEEPKQKRGRPQGS
jgi:lambda family phage portal protein